MTPIASVPFIDGITRDVFLDPDGRQYVIGPDGEKVYGAWGLTGEVWEEAPVVVVDQHQAAGQPAAERMDDP